METIININQKDDILLDATKNYGCKTYKELYKHFFQLALNTHVLCFHKAEINDIETINIDSNCSGRFCNDITILIVII